MGEGVSTNYQLAVEKSRKTQGTPKRRMRTVGWKWNNNKFKNMKAKKSNEYFCILYKNITALTVQTFYINFFF